MTPKDTFREIDTHTNIHTHTHEPSVHSIPESLGNKLLPAKNYLS